MHRIDGYGAAPGGLFTEGNPLEAIPATEVTAEWLNAVQEEIAAVIATADEGLAKADNGQLIKAIKSLSRHEAEMAVCSETDILTSSGNYITKATGWHPVIIAGAGGGGAGGFANAAVGAGGGGGGSGYVQIIYLYLVKGQIIPYVIGAGGVFGAGSYGGTATNGGKGGTTTFAGVSSPGGNGGTSGKPGVIGGGGTGGNNGFEGTYMLNEPSLTCLGGHGGNGVLEQNTFFGGGGLGGMGQIANTASSGTQGIAGVIIIDHPAGE